MRLILLIALSISVLCEAQKDSLKYHPIYYYTGNTLIPKLENIGDTIDLGLFDIFKKNNGIHESNPRPTRYVLKKKKKSEGYLYEDLHDNTARRRVVIYYDQLNRPIKNISETKAFGLLYGFKNKGTTYYNYDSIGNLKTKLLIFTSKIRRTSFGKYIIFKSNARLKADQRSLGIEKSYNHVFYYAGNYYLYDDSLNNFFKKKSDLEKNKIKRMLVKKKIAVKVSKAMLQRGD